MDFNSFLELAWTEHAGQPAAVAERLASPTTLALLQDETQLRSLAALAQHVHGAHLARWAEGVAFQQQLARLPLLQPGSATAAALQQHVAVLRLAGGLEDPRAGAAPAEHLRLAAGAATALCAHDATRAQALLDDALAVAAAHPLPDGDAAVRALAVAGNNIASTLEELPRRSEAERRLMLQAAQVGREYWARAGGWLETERAEYVLSKAWLKAGDTAQAQKHARLCLDIVQANHGPALERLFAWEALGCAARAAGDAETHAAALVETRAAYTALDESDRGWCLASVEALAQAVPVNAH